MSLVVVTKSGAVCKGFMRLPADDGLYEEGFSNIQSRDHFLARGKNTIRTREKVEKLIYLQTYHADHHAYLFAGKDAKTLLHVHYNEGWIIDVVKIGNADIVRERFDRTQDYKKQDDVFRAMVWKAMFLANMEHDGWSFLQPARLLRDVVRNGEALWHSTFVSVAAAERESDAESAESLEPNL